MKAENIKINDDLTMAIITRGDPPWDFVLIHGLASNARLYDGVGECLEAKGYSSIAIDQRGHGMSSKPNYGYSTDQTTQDLFDLYSHFYSGDTHTSPVWVGQSWGGSVVVNFANRHPEYVDAIMAIDGGLIDMKWNFPTYQEASSLLSPPELSHLSPSQLSFMIRKSHPGWSDQAIEATMANLEIDHDQRVRARLSRQNHMTILRELFDYEPMKEIAKLSVPALFLMAQPAKTKGEQDLQRAQETLSHLKDIQIETIEGADHDIHAQMPQVVANYAMGLLGLTRQSHI
ncbi:alpha/beta fold hydrolase [Acidithrix ferrooxidans]|uniref:Tropinesterase n=2 Tax=root TaxID=1 RepID=A0A0D8HIZ6_9ACTN|nr:alpha/beta hydrolase [Acidithrix ferrooxidans]KJF17915.1 tropinesterase [Acidithrix ferrooxidans]